MWAGLREQARHPGTSDSGKPFAPQALKNQRQRECDRSPVIASVMERGHVAAGVGVATAADN